MTRVKVLLIVCVSALVGAGSTFAASHLLWQRQTGTYYCSGTAVSVLCRYNSSEWQVYIDRNTGLELLYKGTAKFICYPYGTPKNCHDLRK